MCIRDSSKAVENDEMMGFVDDHWADEIREYKEERKNG